MDDDRHRVSAGESESSSVFIDSEHENVYFDNGIHSKSHTIQDASACNERLLKKSVTLCESNRRRRKYQHSKSVMENIAVWFGVDEKSDDDDRWKEHVRRRRSRNYLVGQYKENRDVHDDVFDTSSNLQTHNVAMTTYKPTIIDPYSKYSNCRKTMNRQISKISTSSLSKRSLRTTIPVRFGGKESVFKMAYEGFKNAVTPTGLKEKVVWPHHRSITMLKIKSEIPHTDHTDDQSREEEIYLDDVFFNDHITPAVTNSGVSSLDNLSTPDSIFTCKLRDNHNNHNNAEGSGFVGLTKIPNSLIGEVREGRQIGVGFAGFLTEAEYRKSRLDSSITKQISDLEDHRPYFTFWVTFVQIVCYIFAIFAYDLAPFGISTTIVTQEILMPNLAIEESSYSEENNIWMGLRQADLIHMGAKYVGCMRKDERIERYIERDRMNERETACCIRLDGSGCYQTSEDNCSYPFGRLAGKSTITVWKTWRNESGPFGRSSGSVCHQDPRYCLKPPTPLKQHNWPDDITRWPICYEAFSASDLPLEDSDHMTYDVTGRPCCVGIKGQCVITTREDCEFKRGYYHQEALLCSQVDCLEEVCGMMEFLNSDVPDQFYRLFISLFIHAGVIHLLVTVFFQLTVMRDLEKLAGSLRTATIYFMSGVGGSLTSAIFLPHVVEAGPSGSQFGLLACLFVEVIQNWYILKRPLAAILKLSSVLIFLFLLGLMPMIDNFAHLGGFVFGFLSSFTFLPYITFNVTDKKKKRRLVMSCFVVTFVLFIALFLLFYLAPIYNCSFCHYINCLPITPTFCTNMKLTTEII